jgi:protein SSD1
MTDETTQPPTAKKEEKKSAWATGGGNRSKKAPSSSKPASGPANPGGPRPASRGSNKKPPGAASSQTDSNDGSKKKDGDAKKKDGGDNKKADQRGARSQSQSRGGGSGGGNHRKSQTSQSTAGRQGGGNVPKESKPAASAPVPVPGADNSDALTSLQRVITDLKSISPPSQPSAISSSASMPIPQTLVSSNLPPNAPIFQPGAAGFPAPGAAAAESARHRKAASLGSHGSGVPGYPHQMFQFSSQLGAMMEDNEDIRTPQQQQQFEEGEIPEQIYGQQPFPRGSQPPGFAAPRFAALAGQQQPQQQEQGEVIGPSGRPRLAPTFTFGTQRRAASNVPLGPPILEGDDIGFQFPQQQNQQPDYQAESPQQQNNNNGGDNRGQLPDLMREQVRLNHWTSPISRRFLHHRILSSLLFKTRLRRSSISNSSSFNSRWPRTKLWQRSTTRRWDLVGVPMFIGVFKVSKSPPAQ